jgi:hypothetical protein
LINLSIFFSCTSVHFAKQRASDLRVLRPYSPFFLDKKGAKNQGDRIQLLHCTSSLQMRIKTRPSGPHTADSHYLSLAGSVTQLHSNAGNFSIQTFLEQSNIFSLTE